MTGLRYVHMIVLLGCGLLLGAQESNLPKSAEKAIEKYQKKTESIREKALKELTEEREDLLKVLEKEVQRATRRGDLDGALVLRELIESVGEESDENNQQLAEGGGMGDGLLPVVGSSLVQGVAPEYVQRNRNGPTLYYYSAEQREAVLAQLPSPHESLVRENCHAEGPHNPGTSPHCAIAGHRTGNHWAVGPQPGHLRIHIPHTIQGQYLVLITPQTHEIQGLNWEDVTVRANGQDLAEVEHEFDAGDIIVVDLGRPMDLRGCGLAIPGGALASLSAFEVH